MHVLICVADALMPKRFFKSEALLSAINTADMGDVTDAAVVCPHMIGVCVECVLDNDAMVVQTCVIDPFQTVPI